MIFQDYIDFVLLTETTHEGLCIKSVVFRRHLVEKYTHKYLHNS